MVDCRGNRGLTFFLSSEEFRSMSGNTLQECSFLDLFFGDGTEGETVITRTTETKGVDSGLGVGDVVIVPLP